jgi:acyl carrier protein
MIEEQVRAFIVDDLAAYGYGEELADDYPLLRNGLIDSIGIAELVEFIEDEYGVQLTLDELVVENFGTVGQIAALVRSKSEGVERLETS